MHFLGEEGAKGIVGPCLADNLAIGHLVLFLAVALVVGALVWVAQVLQGRAF